jgi:peptide deformylase
MLKIVKDTAKSLHSRCAPVEDPRSPEIKATLDEMTKYLKDSQDPAFREKNPSVREGVGLAAPQVGINKRMLVIYYPSVSEEGKFVEYQLVNPLIVSQSIRQCYLASGEGCLSVDQEHPGYAYRAYKITVKAYDAHRGEDIEIRALGFDAIVLQHEIDHLDGILFYDRIDKKDPFKEIPGSVEI